MNVVGVVGGVGVVDVVGVAGVVSFVGIVGSLGHVAGRNHYCDLGDFWRKTKFSLNTSSKAIVSERRGSEATEVLAASPEGA